MGEINTIKKWDLKSNIWRDVKSEEEKKRALSIATYGTIRHTDDGELNYILIADGCRVENHVHSGQYINDRKAGIANVIKYFERKKENYKIELLLVDMDGPLVEESKLLASYVDHLANLSSTKTVNVVGFSKCGVMAFDMMKYLKNGFSSMKTRVYSVSSPYLGTVMASPLFLEREVRKVITAKIEYDELAEKIVTAVMGLYYRIMSNSHMDLDIAEKGGVPKQLEKNYDPFFLKNIFSEENLSSLNRVNLYKNVCTLIDENTLSAVIKSGNLGGIGLCILNDCLFDGKSDGMVLFSSQKSIESFLSDGENSSVVIHSTHSVLTTPVYAKELMDLVEENLGCNKEEIKSIQ